MIPVQLIFLIVGLILLVKGADFFVEASARIAKKLGVSELVIGLTLVAFGTSIPELASVLVAGVHDYSGIIVGAVVGSNLANIGIILGLAVMVTTVKVKKQMFEGDGFIMVGAVVLFYVLAFDGIISRIEAGFFFLLYIVYMLFVLRSPPTYHFKEFLNYFFKFHYLITIRNHMIRHVINPTDGKKATEKKVFFAFKEGLIKDGIISIVSIGAIVLGAKYFIDGAAWLAELIHIPQMLIGLSVVAIGTSLPELTVAISAARKGLGDMVIGNVLGSNIANILMVIGISGLFSPIAVNSITLSFTAPALIALSILLLVFMRTRWKLSYLEGIALLAVYLIIMIISFVIPGLNGFGF